MKKQIVLGLFALASAVYATSAVQAKDMLNIEVDQSQIVIMPSNPGTVVVGNPSIADVTMQEKKLFIHGRSFGETNITILDLKGDTILDLGVVVQHQKTSNLTVFRGSSMERYSYACGATCESSLQVGDNFLYYDGLLKSTANKIKLATGQDTAEAKAPAAPQ
jgi:hypothetical protein